MPLQATSGAASYDGFGGGVAVVPAYIEDVMSTYVYTGTGATQTITNGIDTTTYGGLVWTKARYLGISHRLVDTARGATYEMSSDTTDASSVNSTGLTSFGTTGYTIGSAGGYNNSGGTYTSWSLRKQPKFFDVVTYTGNGTAGRTVAHNLGSTPGFIIVKNTSSTTNWFCWHRTMPNTDVLRLNSTIAQYDDTTAWNSTTPTSTVFTVGTSIATNNSGDTYVAYLFAHDAGGFGLTGTDNVISCGSFTSAGPSTDVTVTLGYEPQWIMQKNASVSADWEMYDVMRGMSNTNTAMLRANKSDAEADYTVAYFPRPTATGFIAKNSLGADAGNNIIYIAIRRGPMKVPTLGTSVFSPIAASSGTQTTNFPVDMQILSYRTGTDALLNHQVIDRLRGVSSTSTAQGNYLNTSSTAAESNVDPYSSINMSNTGFDVGNNYAGASSVFHSFRRAPGFFDEVCYTGTDADGRAVTHNLTSTPELMIVKSRSASAAPSWWVWNASTSGGLILNSADASSIYNWSPTDTPTSTTFKVSRGYGTNYISQTYVAYLFATCAGVSKVGSYTGTATTKQIDCGFTGGARFVLIKKTSGTGSWYVWDSARGIVSGNDPYLLLNSTAAEVTNTDYIDTYSAGFEISSTAPSEINENGGSFIFLAIS